MPASYATLLIEKEGPIDWVTLNRPEALNTLNGQMVDDLLDYFGGLYFDRKTRIVVLRGAGRAFCAGLDIKESMEARPDDNAPRGPAAGLPEPAVFDLQQAHDGVWGLVVAGVGGTGVITIGQLLGVAAHLEGRSVVTQDAGGLAQRPHAARPA